MAHAITCVRILVLPVVICLLFTSEPGVGSERPHATMFLATFLLGCMFLSDALDGWVARRRGECSDFGRWLDVAADRLVEVSLWVVFAVRGGVPSWIPAIVIARAGLSALFAQSVDSRLKRVLCDPAWSRGGYGVAKVTCFVLLMLDVGTVASVTAYITVGFCAVRAVPVLYGLLGRRLGSRYSHG